MLRCLWKVLAAQRSCSRDLGLWFRYLLRKDYAKVKQTLFAKYLSNVR